MKQRPQAAHGHDERREPHDEEHVEPAEGVERHQSFGLFHNSACTKTGNPDFPFGVTGRVSNLELE